MELQNFLQLVQQKRKAIFGIMAIFIVLGAVVISVQKFKFGSESRLLVVQENQGAVDAYTASKSSEHLSSVLASVVKSNSFFTKVTSLSPTINTDYFGSTPKEQIKEWGKTVKAESINDSGIIAINVYHPNKVEAEKISGAINYVLMTQHSAYDGAGDAVKVRLIDQPITSTFPVKPNILLILGLAIALGFLSSLIYVYLLPSENSIQLNNFLPSQAPVSPRTTNFQTEKMQVDFGGYRHMQPEKPNIIEQRRPTSQYGEHASVLIQDHPELFPDIEDSIDPETIINPETIIHQGSMRNILD